MASNRTRSRIARAWGSVCIVASALIPAGGALGQDLDPLQVPWTDTVSADTDAGSTDPGNAANDGLDTPQFLQTLVNPADKAGDRARDARDQATTQMSGDAAIDPRRPANPFANHVASYDLPAVDVVGEPLSGLREEDRVGPYAQPRWTARRFTPGTRVYVRPPGTIELEYWLRPTITKDGDTEIRSLYEIGIGLPYRFQVDFYLRTDSDGDGEETRLGQQVEVRWALADWGKIWGNPTLYAEWVQKESEADQIELKLLLGDEISPRWHWGVNLVGELDTGGSRTYEYQLTGGVVYALEDSVLSLGVEGQVIASDEHGNRGSYTTEIFLGPTIQWRPFEQLRIAFAPLVGLTTESPDFRAYLNVGWEF